jgi:hypothetical protein
MWKHDALLRPSSDYAASTAAVDPAFSRRVLVQRRANVVCGGIGLVGGGSMTVIPTPTQALIDPAVFARVFLRILDKQGQLVPLRYNATQRQYLANRTGRDLVLKARQLGISTCVQAEFFRYAVIGTAITVTLAHEDDTTQRFRRMVNRFYTNIPGDRHPARKYSNARLATYPDFDSESIIATAGNTNTGRGGMATHIHGSEIAFWKDAEALMAGLMQGGSPSWIVLESTPNGAQGYFYTKCMEALDGNRDWALHFFPWWLDPQYKQSLADGETMNYSADEQALVERYNLTPEQINWRRVKQRELKYLFSQEYPEDPRTCFLQSGNGYFGDLSDVFTAPLDATYQEGHRYVAGLDFGQTTDYTACAVIDCDTKQQVDQVHVNRLPWKEMRRQVVQACKRWYVGALWAEANSMGTTNIEALISELGEAGCQTMVMPFDTTNDSKFTIMANLHDALHEGGLKLLPHPAQQHEFAAFQATQTTSGLWRLAAPDVDGEHDDTVISLALANHARLFGGNSYFVVRG